MNPALDRLQAYPFERLRQLLADAVPPAALGPIALSIGEPRHAPPREVLAALATHLDQLGIYPATRGLPELRAAMAAALERSLVPTVPEASQPVRLDPDTMVLPVNGTREALFAFAQAVTNATNTACGRPLVAMPNPFYQIYEGAALLAGADPYFLNTTAATGYLPDLDAVPAAVWERCQLLYLCSPGNPTGAVAPLDYLRHALALAHRHDFVIAADECYADLYLDEARPPPSLLQAAVASGDTRLQRCVVFRSLSKRSSLPGLRSGVVAGDPAVLERFALYRTYHGCAMSVPIQLASIVAWNDDAHVLDNRRQYREKFARVMPLLAPLFDFPAPQGGFYLWPDVRGDDSAFVRELYQQQHLTLLPGSYLARAADGINPGTGRVRISLVPQLAQCVEAAERICDFARSR
jgi:N-succinyldiaminopimelate aminotransferase